MPTDSLVLSSNEVADLAGVFYRQIDYWSRIGLVTPSVEAAAGSGSRRRFSERDLLVVATVGALVADQRLGDLGWLSKLCAYLGELEELSGLVFLTRDGRPWRSLPPGATCAWLVDLDAIAAKVEARMEAAA